MTTKPSKRLSVHLRHAMLVTLTLALFSGCTRADISKLFKTKPASPELLVPKVLATWPHDPGSFTEGLVWYNGFLYESSGLYGKSNIRKVDPQTGLVLERKDDPSQVFGEGLALKGGQLFQLTWREHAGYVYDMDNFTQVGAFSYTGEGWGLCFDGQDFFMSDGSASINRRDPQTFAVINNIQVMQKDKPVNMLNELECVGDQIYANIWMTNNIVRIDKLTGEVTGVIDASGLLTGQELAQAGSNGVLNGIAYDPGHAVFLITGKLWPKLFEVEFVPKGGE